MLSADHFDWFGPDDEDDDNDFTCDGDCGFCFAYDDEDE